MSKKRKRRERYCVKREHRVERRKRRRRRECWGKEGRVQMCLCKDVKPVLVYALCSN